jgi:hypothetical protein
MMDDCAAESQGRIFAKKWEDTGDDPCSMGEEVRVNKTDLELVFSPVAGCII